jgi:hypothetical protein
MAGAVAMNPKPLTVVLLPLDALVAAVIYQ